MHSPKVLIFQYRRSAVGWHLIFWGHKLAGSLTSCLAGWRAGLQAGGCLSSYRVSSGLPQTNYLSSLIRIYFKINQNLVDIHKKYKTNIKCLIHSPKVLVFQYRREGQILYFAVTGWLAGSPAARLAGGLSGRLAAACPARQSALGCLRPISFRFPLEYNSKSIRMSDDQRIHKPY